MEALQQMEQTFMGLNKTKVRVQLFDDVRLFFNRLLCYIPLPLPEAKLKEKVKGCIAQTS